MRGRGPGRRGAEKAREVIGRGDEELGMSKRCSRILPQLNEYINSGRDEGVVFGYMMKCVKLKLFLISSYNLCANYPKFEPSPTCSI